MRWAIIVLFLFSFVVLDIPNFLLNHEAWEIEHFHKHICHVVPKNKPYAFGDLTYEFPCSLIYDHLLPPREGVVKGSLANIERTALHPETIKRIEAYLSKKLGKEVTLKNCTEYWCCMTDGSCYGCPNLQGLYCEVYENESNT